MIDAVCGDRRAALGLGEDESALQNRLRVQREVFGGPIGVKPMSFDRFCDVGLDLSGVAADGAVDAARIAGCVS